MYYFVEGACTIAEAWMIHIFLSGLFYTREENLWSKLLGYGLFCMCIIVLSFAEDASFIRLGITFCGVLLLSVFLFKAKFSLCFFASITLCLIVLLTDIITTILLNLCGLDTNVLMQYGSARCIYLALEHVILFAVILVFRVIKQAPKGTISAKLLLPLAPCWIITLLLCCLLAWEVLTTNVELSPLYLIIVTGLLYTNLTVIYYNDMQERYQREKRDMEIAEHHYAM